MKKNYFIFMLVLALCSCKKELSKEGSNTNTSTQVDIYVAGADTIEIAGYGIPVYWKNGKPVYYTDGTISYSGTTAEATSVAVVGNEVYMTGYAQFCGPFRCSDRGMFWKNGISEFLNLPDYPRSLTVSNNDIYITGNSGYLDGTGGNAAYLKNGDKIDLPSGSTGAMSTALAVSGTDVYVSGIGITGNIYNGPQNHIAKYWKNGNAMNLTDGSHFAQAWSIAVSGNDAYVAGMEWNGRTYQDANGNPDQKSVAKYWKNGNPVILSDGTEEAWANAITVSGADVYVAGTEWNGNPYQIQGSAYIYRKSIARYWKNGKVVNLTDGTEDAEAKSIAVSGTDVYVAGTVNGYATYWKNGVAVRLSKVESDANAVFLVKK
ncbi:MAG: hypothetical protein HYX40_05990 [Sphingobacteriales bacterium]|nr:hypothetical protein [Sphingobacteriales bacterium]